MTRRPRLASMLTISGAVLATMGLGCPPSPTAPVTPRADPELARTEAFLSDERAILGLLAAADARIGNRTGIQPSDDQSGKAVLGAILAEDQSAALESGRTDVFSFDVRARALASAKKNVAPYAQPIADPHPTDGRRPELERQLLVRLIAEEEARLAEERDLPRSSATLVRAIAATWTPPKSMADLEKRDAWFATRIGTVRATLAPKTLRSADIADLEDALDPLERVAFTDGTPYAKSHSAFTELRIALGSLAAGPGPDAATARIAFVESLRAHLGVTLSPETLARILENAASMIERDFAGLVGAKLDGERLGMEAKALLDRPRCTYRATSLLRHAPPPERAFGCVLAARAEKSGTADELAGVLASAHTALTVGSWALWMLSGADAVKPATEHAKLLRQVAPEIVARLERRALTSPVNALGDALAAEWLYRNGMTASATRALAWMLFGDAPYDLLERDLHPESVVPQKPPVVKVTEEVLPMPSATPVQIAPPPKR